MLVDAHFTHLSGLKSTSEPTISQSLQFQMQQTQLVREPNIDSDHLMETETTLFGACTDIVFVNVLMNYIRGVISICFTCYRENVGQC